ncbi:MAG: RHS repeat-associated core domain-containing protein [Sphingomonadaceae bacterium]
MRIRNAFLSTAAVIAPALLVPQVVHAQSVTLDPAPIRQSLDENGVDLSSGGIAVPSSRVGIGGAEGLTHVRYRVGNGWRHNYMLTIEKELIGYENGVRTYWIDVNIGGQRARFKWSENAASGEAQEGERGTLAWSATTDWTYTTANGVDYQFSRAPVVTGASYYGPVEAVGTQITQPDGRATTLTYRQDSYQQGFASIWVTRLQSVNNNSGYQLKFSYAANTPADSTIDDWYEISRVTAINNAEEYCAPAADTCALATQWPFLSYSLGASGSDTIETVTDVLGRSSQFRFDAGDRLRGLKRAGEASEGMTVDYDNDSRVQQVTRQGSYERYYDWTVPWLGGLASISTDQLSRQRKVTSNVWGQVTETEDALGNKTQYVYDYPSFSLKEVIAPEGNKVVYTRDARGRVTQTSVYGKAGGTPITTSATYPALISGTEVCANPVICDKPLTTTDELGNVTNYEWDQVHGGLLKVTQPAPSAGAARPETRVTYLNHQARYYQNGTLQVGAAFVQPNLVRTCQTGAGNACALQANERITQFFYDNTVNPNGQATTVTTKAGNGSIATSTSRTYHPLGGVETADGPIPGTTDTTTIHYDLAGQVVATVSPDPDGTGGNPRLAARMTYNADGQVITSESGYVTGTTAADVANMAVTRKSLTTYDDFGRVATQADVHPTQAIRNSLVQQSYDLAGRPTCTAVRMNAPYTYTAIPADACTPMGPGAYGYDRISARYYNVADQVIETRSGLGSPVEQVSAKLAYTPNGAVDWVEDAEQNRTNYVQDAFDRVVEIQYPSKTTKNTANPADNELVSYLADGSISTHTTRMDEQFIFHYDNLGRMVTRYMPNRLGLAYDQRRHTFYKYDNFGAMTEARFDSATSAYGVFFSYDALGRLTQEQNTVSGRTWNIGYQYDSAGRRSRLTYPDGAFVTYSYDTLSRPTGVWRQGTDAVRTWTYNGQGQVSAMGPGFDTQFVYADSGRLFQQSDYGSDSSAWSYNRYSHNPAGQVEEEQSWYNNAIWDGHQPETVGYTANGLNQYTVVDGKNFTYDANGNLTADGTDTFTYDPANRLIGVPSKGATLAYDPLGRLHSVTDASGTERFLYDGNALIMEFNAGGGILARHVHGLSAGDDPIASYTGSLFAASNEQLIRQDRLGSVMLMSTDRTTATVNVNAYDEYGVPGSGNTGRFQYTGQVWLPQIGLYHYKARTYSPTLGRFLQTDPIRYGDGLNMYTYVGNDPINALDPLGLNKVKPKNPDGSCDEGWFETSDGQCGKVIITADRYDDTYSVGKPDGLVPDGGDGFDEQGRPKACAVKPKVVDFKGRSGVLGVGVGGIDLVGTLTDPLTGRTWSIEATVKVDLAAGIGVFNLSGTLAIDPESLAEGMNLVFASVGAVGFGASAGRITASAGGGWDINVSPMTPGAASVGVDFENVEVKQKSNGKC